MVEDANEEACDEGDEDGSNLKVGERALCRIRQNRMMS